MTINWQWTDASHRVVVRTNADGAMESHLIADPSIAAWLAADGTPDASPALSPAAQVAQAVAAGCAIVSTATPALNGTYAIDTPSKATIDGVYASIKSGDGLPGGGSTFNYSDITGAMHAFNATNFPLFAKAIRDYLYALSQGQAPAQPVTIA